MATTILFPLIDLLPLMCVSIVVACLLARSRFFPEVLVGHSAIKTHVSLILVFTALSRYGPVAGNEFNRAITGRVRGMDSKEIMAKILDAVKEFCGEQPRSDDITLMVIEVN